jgi:hypothetical protein
LCNSVYSVYSVSNAVDDASLRSMSIAVDDASQRQNIAGDAL